MTIYLTYNLFYSYSAQDKLFGNYVLCKIITKRTKDLALKCNAIKCLCYVFIIFYPFHYAQNFLP